MTHPSSCIALVDCNNFFVSCERVFNPKLWGIPVVVLSSNDGCIIARSEEAKKLGIPMGAAAFKYQKVLKDHNVKVYSSNFELYSDMSARIMNTLTEYSPSIEIYSIDEAFIDLTTIPAEQRFLYAQALRDRVTQWTGVPVSFGLAPTKTLAKVANDMAKKASRGRPSLGIGRQSPGVCYLDTQAAIDAALQNLPVGDVWGIGYRYSNKLNSYNIRTTAKLLTMPDEWIRKKMTINGLRTIWELRGIPCISLEEIKAPNQTIIKSRSFGVPVRTLSSLKEAVATYVTIAAETLREQKQLCGGICVWLQTSWFVAQEHRYHNSNIHMLELPTAYTPTMIAAATKMVEQMYRPDFAYKKAGIMLVDLSPGHTAQLPLFIPTEEIPKQTHAMQAVDEVNNKWGSRTVFFAASGVDQHWKSNRQLRSQRYTTQWDELLHV